MEEGSWRYFEKEGNIIGEDDDIDAGDSDSMKS